MKKLSILLVDDEYLKAQNILSSVRDAGVPMGDMIHLSTASAARAYLQKNIVDLLIIDLDLPEMMGAPPKPDGGLNFFDMVCLDEKTNLPTDVIFITGKEELVEKAKFEAACRGAHFCSYSLTNDAWKDVIISKARYIGKRINRGAGSYPEVDIAIVTALRQPELDAVMALPYGWEQRRYANNSTAYSLGEISRQDGALSVVAAAAQRKGMPSSAALATQMCALFRPKYLVMLGICAGIPGKTNIGDVIVADPTWDWGSGKVTDEDGSPVFKAAPHQRPLSTHMSQIALDASVSAPVHRSIRAGWNGKNPEGNLKIHVGPMASGASVLADGGTLREIITQHRELLAVEMEAYAVMAAAEYTVGSSPIAIVIKSVCDFADASKNDNWQDYAAYTSAAFFDELFRNGNLPVA